ncbi:pyridoxal phosphate-dependent aminotransferase [Paenibacillus campi]|uniref:pyridoxal phosphate-dependent aminotransferase n=1 Tax=Paenibacillus campi TaxID=3106031 RepID=UPI002AFE084F|nr:MULTISPECIES: pyridoxal phosphate-dependent aminotransferase [unclassified Paenibacillus]
MHINRSETVLDLSFGDIRGGPHPAIRKYVSELALDVWEGYVPSGGLRELRERLAEHLQSAYEHTTITADHIMVTNGASAALAVIYSLLKNKTVLIPNPGFPLYHKLLSQMDIAYEQYPLHTENNWSETLLMLEQKLQQGASAVIWNFPNNPLGIVPPPEVVEQFCALCKTYKALCISDEVYRDFAGGQPFYSPARWLPEQTLLVYSFSKAFAMAGARLGCIVGHPLMIRTLMSRSWNTSMSAPSFSQRAALYALTYYADYPCTLSAQILGTIEKAHQLLRNANVPFYACKAGIFVCLDISQLNVSAAEFAVLIYKKYQILVMTGSEFGEQAQQMIRLSMGADEQRVLCAVQNISHLYHEIITNQEAIT